MIIDKVKPFWTQDDLRQIEDLRKEQEEVIRGLSETEIFEDRFNILNKYHDIDLKAEKIRKAVEGRYIESKSKKEVLTDIEEIVSAFTKEDYLEHVAWQLNNISNLKEEGAKEATLNALREIATENYEHCYGYMLRSIRVQLNAFANDEKNADKARAIVEHRISQWYRKPTPPFLQMAHGKPTDAFAYMSKRNAKTDPITGTATIDKFDVQLAIAKFEERQTALGISTDKLLSFAIAVFTNQNDFRHRGKEINRTVYINLKDYARLLGYDVDEQETSTPEEEKKEKKRAKTQLDNARKAIKADLLSLQKFAFGWEETMKGKPKDFDSISLVTRVQIRNGEIIISFTPEIASYLAERNLITQYPTKLLGISGRKPTAYYIGRKLAEHYSIDNNQLNGTQDLLSIPALLAVTDLPSYEEVQEKDRGHWAERIKEPLERALDELTKEGYLKDWEYTHAKKVPLTEEEATNLTSYRDYEGLYLHFTLADKIESGERLEEKRKAREQAKKNAQRRKKATNKKPTN